MELNNGHYRVEIRWTTKAIPHIKAETIGEAGFGQGYACAKQHIATLLDQIVKVRGERSKYFGAGKDDINILSDAGYRFLNLRKKAEENFKDLSIEPREFLIGYASGVNHFLKNATEKDFPAWARGSAWINPITQYDLMAYCSDIALAAGSRNLIPFMALAAPPDENGPKETPPISMLPGGSLASNGWAIGGDISYNAKGMIVGNPHFPWVGENRFWECHLTVGDKIDCYGVTLIGAPGILIGFNKNVAWTHTFSIGKRFIVYKLDLLEGYPNRYRYGSEVREMTETSVAVEVLGESGLTTVKRKMYSSHYGPMLNLPMLGWTGDFALTVKDANDGNRSFISQFMRMDASNSFEDFKKAHIEENGMPWANTIATDTNGDTWYIDSSRTLNLSDAGKAILKQKLETDPLTKMLYDNRIMLLDGSDPNCDSVDKPGAPLPGLVAYEDYPQLTRRDFVFNANDSAWLTNPRQPLEISTYLQGLQEPPSVRTRACLSFLMSYDPHREMKMTLEDMIEFALSNKSIVGLLIKDQLAALCDHFAGQSQDSVDGNGVDFAKLGEVLRGWDGCFNLESKGAILFREIIAGFDLRDLKDKGNLFADSFDISNSYGTPSKLVDPKDAAVVKDVIVRAVKALQDAKIDIDSSPQQVQYAHLSHHKYYVHGGHETDGTTNILTPVFELPYSSSEPREDHMAAGEPILGRTNKTGIRKGGYVVSQGTSFFYALSFTQDGPLAYGFLTYGQNEDIESSNHADQIQDYIDKRPRKLLFAQRDIQSCKDLIVENITS